MSRHTDDEDLIAEDRDRVDAERLAAEPTLYNVVVPVVANLTGATGDEARNKLRAALKAAGFEPIHTDEPAMVLEPFVAEPDTEEDVLPH